MADDGAPEENHDIVGFQAYETYLIYCISVTSSNRLSIDTRLHDLSQYWRPRLPRLLRK